MKLEKTEDNYQNQEESHDDYFSSNQVVRKNLWFEGTIMSHKESTSPLLRRLAIRHNRITYEKTGMTTSVQKTSRVVSLLAEFFPVNYLDFFWQLISKTYDKIEQVNPQTGVVETKIIHRYKFNNDQERAALLLAFMSLILEKKRLYLSEKVISDINSFTGYSLTKKEIRSCYLKIKKNNPGFYKKFAPESIIGPNPRVLINAVIAKFNELDKTDLDKETTVAITKKALEICLRYSKHPKFKFQKYEGFDSTALAIIADAYSKVTKRKGIPFNYDEQQLNYIYQRRSHVRKFLRELQKSN